MKPSARTNRNIAIFGGGVLVTMLVLQFVHWRHGAQLDWLYCAGTLGLLLLLTGQQLLAESFHKTRLWLTCLGVAVFVSCSALRVWTSVHPAKSAASSATQRATSNPSTHTARARLIVTGHNFDSRWRSATAGQDRSA